MNKKLLISMLLCIFVFSMALLSQEESKEKKIWGDERISITVDKVERADSFPEELRSPHATYLPPKKGHDLVLIHITVVEKRDLKIGMTGLRLQRPKSPHLIDNQGNTYWADFAQYFYGPSDSTTFGKNGYLVFVMPKVATPVQLKYVYPYKGEPPKPKKKKYGQIDIDLSYIQ